MIGTDGRPAGAIPDLLEHVFESLPTGLVVFDNDLKVILKNQAAAALLPDEEDISKAISRLAVESKYEDWDAEFRQVMGTGRPQRFDVTVQDGGDYHPEVCVNIVINSLRDPETGESLGGLLLVEDVTSRISMERRLAVSERLAAVGKLAARVAHELNNPLDGILRYTNLALRRVGDDSDPKAVEYLEKAKSGIGRMGEIITTLLEFSRSTPSTFEQATINKIVEDAITAMEGRAREVNVTVVCNFHQTDMPVVRGSNMFQVFCNVIKNAIDAMPQSGTLTISTGIVGPDVVVTFEDTGIGLPKEADKIFEPFFTTKEPGKGTGLGLAVCKELIEKYGGTITAKRRQPRGTTVTVSIPTRNCAAVPLSRSLRSRNKIERAAGADGNREAAP
ncbi:MAG: PAS domain-containing protein [Phycisphaerae bacterium]|nr:PAS domain-containing protein [Phycisphaerae bacterium]